MPQFFVLLLSSAAACVGVVVYILPLLIEHRAWVVSVLFVLCLWLGIFHSRDAPRVGE